MSNRYFDKFDMKVLYSIVKDVVKNNPNVHEFSERFIDRLNLPFTKQKDEENGIRVLKSDNGYILELYLIVHYGVKIPELAWDLQVQIKDAIEEKFGINIDKVNVHVQGVSLR